jgi:protein-S-isoprenylcysteine O-methyltransferase Ste14
MTEYSLHTSPILPPKGLLVSLVAQLPLIASSLPVHPSRMEVAAGTMLIAAGAILNIWSERLFRRNDVGVCPFTRVPVLIEAGPYRLMRNPMYLGFALLTLGAAVLSGVLANAWSAIAYIIWLHYAFVPPEEEFLRRERGAAFDNYARRVPRWLPGSHPAP